MKTYVGFVLSGIPGYSEVFLTNTIKVLMNKGMNVILFTDKPGKVSFVQHVSGYALPVNRVFRIFKIFFVLSFTFLCNPARVFRFFSIHRSNRKSFSTIIKNLFISAHILPYRLTHIHFGFATLGVHREYLGRVMGAKLSTSIRGYDVSIYPLLHKNVYRLLWKNLDCLHTISDDLHKVAIGLGLPSHVPTVKINPAVDVSQFQTFEGISINESIVPIRIVTVARLHWKKGIEYALEALLILKNMEIEFIYTVIGAGKEREKLFFLVHQMGLIECVEFAGKLAHNQVISRLAKAHLYLQPSVQEGFCNAVLEAQASGLLCIVSDAEGLQENVLHGQTGWVVPRRNPQALAECIQQVNDLSNEEKQLIRQAAYDRVKREFDLSVQAEKFADFFQHFESSETDGY